jgi:hypothetical protein
MKWSPSPGIIGNPRPTIVGKDPVTIGAIRTEIPIYIGYPNISVVLIVYPRAIGA